MSGEFGQVPSKAVERGCFALRSFSRWSCLTASRSFRRPFGTTFDAVTQKIQNFFADIFELQTEVHQNLCGNTFLFPDQPEQEVFGADVVMVEVPRLFHGVLDNFFARGV